MTKICNFPISKKKRCTQPVADGKPNCGRHHCEISADQLEQNPTIYKKGDELHVWAGEPDSPYCLIHNDPAYQAPRSMTAGTPSCCLRNDVERRDDHDQLHREDGPALISTDGTQQWYWHGWLHRDDGPAVIEPDGTQKWYQGGELHRNDGPAVIEADGTQKWYQNGELHRNHFPFVKDDPVIIEPDGTQQWYQHGKLHRNDGPAVIEPDGTQWWFQHGLLHRDDGPAAVYPDGTEEWYWDDKEVTAEEHAKLREQFAGDRRRRQHDELPQIPVEIIRGYREL
jgi:hypothetical protein